MKHVYKHIQIVCNSHRENHVFNVSSTIENVELLSKLRSKISMSVNISYISE